MKTPELQIDEALLTLQLKGARKLPAAEAADVARRAQDTFVRGNPRVWWLELVGDVRTEVYGAGDWRGCLEKALFAQRASVVHLIPESDTSEYAVYECRRNDVSKLVDACTFFEYYVVDSRAKWLVADTEHDAIIVVKVRR